MNFNKNFQINRITVLYKNTMPIDAFEKAFFKWINVRKIYKEDVFVFRLIPINLEKKKSIKKTKEICYTNEYQKFFNIININFFMQLKYISMFRFRYNSAHFVKLLKSKTKSLQKSLINLHKIIKQPSITLNKKMYFNSLSKILKSRNLTFYIKEIQPFSNANINIYKHYFKKHDLNRVFIGMTEQERKFILTQINNNKNK